MKYRCIVMVVAMLMASLAVVADDTKRHGLEVSVLTCEPGEAIYELYGHTAIRVRELRPGGRDEVFNYGVFDFTAPGFVWRFVKGETDYEVWSIPYSFVYNEYMRQGRRVWQQTLALDSAQEASMAAMLRENCRPENRRYRYNFLYDNCTTRCRDMIEAVAQVAWPKAEPKTYREMIHEFAGRPHESWEALGQDLLLGWAVDTLIGVREQMFSPIYFMRFLDEAQCDGRALVEKTLLTVNPNEPERCGKIETLPDLHPSGHRSLLTPLCALLLWAVFGVSLFMPRVRRCVWGRRALLVWYVATVVIVVAVAAVIDMLYFFSSHPAVDTNNLVWVFNPLALLMVLVPFRPKISLPF